MALKIETLDSGRHIRKNFCCGKDSLDNYIRKQASQDIKRRVSIVFVLIDDPEMNVLAYYTLSAYTVDLAVLDQAFAKRLPRYPVLPATLLGRLAVDNSQKGKRFGELMLVDALKKSLDAATQVASLAVIAEAVDQGALSFYIKYGFQQFRQDHMKLIYSKVLFALRVPAGCAEYKHSPNLALGVALQPYESILGQALPQASTLS